MDDVSDENPLPKSTSSLNVNERFPFEDWMYVASIIIYTIFLVPIARAQNVATVIVCRLIAGLACSTVSNLEPLAKRRAHSFLTGLYPCWGNHR